MDIDTKQRQSWIGLLAQALPQELESAYEELESPPDYQLLRQPECGLAMVRARAGGTGQAFNFGEITITRASVTLGDYTGHAYLKGRNKRHAELAAVFDALLQNPQHHNTLSETLLTSIFERLEQRQQQHQEKTDATRVEFFTMVRGESS